MIDFDPDARLNQLGARFTVNNLQYKEDGEKIVRGEMFKRMCHQLSAVLTQDGMRKTEGVYSTEYEVRLYVLTPDQLEKYVQRRVRDFGFTPHITEQTYQSHEK